MAVLLQAKGLPFLFRRMTGEEIDISLPLSDA